MDEEMIKPFPGLTVESLFEKMEEFGASKMELVFYDNNDEPAYAVIVVKGNPETKDTIEAVDAMQERWDEE